MKQKTLSVEPRTQTGRGPARRLRVNKKVPAIVYGAGQTPSPITIVESEFRMLMRSISGAAAIIELKGLDRTILSVIQEIKRNPRTDTFDHVDFHEVCATEIMHTVLPVHIKGESYGVKNESAVLDFVMHQIPVKCLPKDLPEYIEVDITNLRLHQSIHIKDLQAIPGVTFEGHSDQVVIACVEQKAPEEPEPEAATPAPAAASSPAKTAAPASTKAAAPAAKAPAKPAAKK